LGYLRDGKYTTIHNTDTMIEREIMEEIKQMYRRRFGWRFTEDRFNALSSQEQNDVIHQAGLKVQARRKSR
jgi:hypothetical protein